MSSNMRKYRTEYGQECITHGKVNIASTDLKYIYTDWCTAVLGPAGKCLTIMNIRQEKSLLFTALGPLKLHI